MFKVKELGVIGYNCSCIAKDMSKLFAVYWYLGLQNSTVPTKWPRSFATDYNNVTPMTTKINGSDSSIYLSVRKYLLLLFLYKILSGGRPSPFSSKTRAQPLLTEEIPFGFYMLIIFYVTYSYK